MRRYRQRAKPAAAATASWPSGGTARRPRRGRSHRHPQRPTEVRGLKRRLATGDPWPEHPPVELFHVRRHVRRCRRHLRESPRPHPGHRGGRGQPDRRGFDAVRIHPRNDCVHVHAPTSVEWVSARVEDQYEVPTSACASSAMAAFHASSKDLVRLRLGDAISNALMTNSLAWLNCPFVG